MVAVSGGYHEAILVVRDGKQRMHFANIFRRKAERAKLVDLGSFFDGIERQFALQVLIEPC